MTSLNFEDTVFILNMRIRVIRDTLCLSPPPGLFLEKMLDDLGFIDIVLSVLVKTLAENSGQLSGNGEFDSVSDAEWQFSQLLTEISYNFGPFSPQASAEIREKISALRENSGARAKDLAKSAPETLAVAAGGPAEPVVSSAELNGLWGG